jgi:alkanesulfonate monooxygenase SsuD/methylene tetrahydromethanopterin reductase-like flavin-dependent oxidoreductase (luciferase family)
MHFGVSMFHTDYSIPAVELARALEARGFESMWAPEHSHIPVPRKTPFPGGGELPEPYYEVMDPFLFGVGGGWNREEIEGHATAFGTRFKLMRERIEAMKRSGRSRSPNITASS